MSRRAAKRWKILGLALFSFTTAACRRDMQTQPKYTALAVSGFWPDGRAARPIPAGAIAIDEIDDTPALTTGSVNGAFVTTFPVPVTAGLLARGQERFDIYCAPCHSRTGDAHGMIERQGLKQPADLNDARVRNAPPGYLFQVISNGYGAMDDYLYQIKNVRDRWAIVAYIRALELSRRAALSDLSAADRSALEARQ